MQFEYALGATPLDPDEAAGLVPKHIKRDLLDNCSLGKLVRLVSGLGLGLSGSGWHPVQALGRDTGRPDWRKGRADCFRDG